MNGSQSEVSMIMSWVIQQRIITVQPTDPVVIYSICISQLNLLKLRLDILVYVSFRV